MLRVAVVGPSGSGKTTTARQVARRLAIPRIELDAIFHQAGWTELPDDEFRRRVTTMLDARGNWVCDGNYGTVRPLVLARATDVIWLDPPRWVVMVQIVPRSIVRTATGQELGNPREAAQSSS